jgi:uncharacterized protein
VIIRRKLMSAEIDEGETESGSDAIELARAKNGRHVEIRRATDKGRGVYALRRFAAGETVIVGLVARPETQRTVYSIQLDWDRHALFEEPAVLINHSCQPNVVVSGNRFGGYDFIALHDIATDEEIAFDYATTEFESIAVPNCICGARACRGSSGGFIKLPADHPLRSRGLVAPYLRQEAAPAPPRDDREKASPPIAGRGKPASAEDRRSAEELTK